MKNVVQSNYTDVRSRLLDDAVLDKIEKAIERGDRIEIVPSKNGAKILHVKKQQI